MEYEIVKLEKSKWKDYILPIGYTTDKYYDVDVRQTEAGFRVDMELKAFDMPVTHSPDEYDYPDKLYAEHFPGAYAWGIIDDNGELAAAIETCPEEWSNRLRITELWVREDYRCKGVGHELISIAREQAHHERRRAIMLETQSCNVNAIGFYLHEGFTLTGFDSCCYKNDDLARKEVRIELGIIKQKKRLTRDEVEIRPEREEDYHETELVAQRAFWNKHHQGCDEHYLVHIMRKSADYLPQYSRIALVNGRIAGGIYYSRAWIRDNEKEYPIATFGPLCVDPDFQGMGVGEMLLRETMSLAAADGIPAILIYGEPDYYPRIGFITADNFGVTTPDGKNFAPFMGIELIPGGMAGKHGKFYESKTFDELPEDAVREYCKLFPRMKLRTFPGQWD